MDFRDFVLLAEALASGASEAEWRTAISRAYYGAFHVGCDFLREIGFAVPKADRAHAYAILRLSNSGDADLNQAGQRLSELRTLRNRADYEGRRRFESADAEQAVEASHEIIDSLDETRRDPIRSDIMEAIKTYERDVLKETTWQG